MTCLKRFAEVKLISDTHMQSRIHIDTHTKPHTPVSVMEETTELYHTQPYTAKKKKKAPVSQSVSPRSLLQVGWSSI